MMQKVALVTDSTCDIPPDIATTAGIHIVPLTVLIDDIAYADDDRIDRYTLHNRILDAVRATTSQPSPGQFANVYSDLHRRGLDVISVHVSAELSGTLQSAVIAKQMVSKDIEIVDSRTSSLAMGLAVIKAARAAQAGSDKDTVLSCLRASLHHSIAYFTVGSLHHLHKIGRLGKLQAVIGSLLGVSPILSVVNGQIAMTEKSWGQKAVGQRLLELIATRVGDIGALKFGLVHIQAEEFAQLLKQRIYEMFHCTEFIFARSGATMAAAVGPGSVGVFCCPE